MRHHPPLRGLVLSLLSLLVASSCVQVAPSEVDSASPLLDSSVAALADTQPTVPERRMPLSATSRDADDSDQPTDGAGAGEAAHTAMESAQRPAWLGTIPLPSAPPEGGFLPTPPELDDRRLPSPPSSLSVPEGEAYASSVSAVPPDVQARSTWHPGCPVDMTDLRYVTVTHWGFDGQVRTGELIVHHLAAEQIAAIFGRLHAERFPIEELRVISPADMTALSTGDGNVSSAFVCRPSTASRRWSEHAWGTSLDLNPFQNPYVKGSFVVPGLAGSYVDRERDRPGMIQPDDVVVRAFAEVGWQWGGDWGSSKDWMHFSANGR